MFSIISFMLILGGNPNYYCDIGRILSPKNQSLKVFWCRKEFHHAVQFGLDFRNAQHGEIVNVFLLVIFQMNFTMLYNLGWIAELHNMVKLSTFSFW